MNTVRPRSAAYLLSVLFALFLAACQTAPISRPLPAEKPAGSTVPAEQQKPVATVPPAEVVPPAVPVPAQPYALLKPVAWETLPGLQQENWRISWPAWLQGCEGLRQKPDWREVCTQALLVDASSAPEIERYWRQYFTVYATAQASSEPQGLMTGYYQPLLKGSRTKTSRYAVPLYKAPNDLITVNLGNLFPELKYKRVRGRLQGQTLVPYLTRAEIEQAPSPLNGSELAWVENAVEAFFMQVQGSGVIMLEGGERLPVGYADQNGHPYQSIGRLLVERGEMTASEASMQSIKAWVAQHPAQLRGLLDANPSYVFFKPLPVGLPGPLGALGVPLTAARSIAVDPFYIPLGAPVYLATTYPNSTQALQQLMMAQDTGGAIKGGVRADVYWGEGDAAGKLAGAMRQQGRLWIWLPKGFRLPQ